MSRNLPILISGLLAGTTLKVGKFFYRASMGPEKTNVGVGLAFLELLHIHLAIFGLKITKFGPVEGVGHPWRQIWARECGFLARISLICILEHI
jgi:hypothetical protein